MGRRSRIGTMATLGAVVGALLMTGSTALASGGPVATKSGALINYVTTGKLRIGKKIEIDAVCSVDCNVRSHSVIVGPRFKDKLNVSGPLTAGVPGGPILLPNGPLLSAMKSSPGRFKIQNTLTATDPATGASDKISHTFKLKR